MAAGVFVTGVHPHISIIAGQQVLRTTPQPERLPGKEMNDDPCHFTDCNCLYLDYEPLGDHVHRGLNRLLHVKTRRPWRARHGQRPTAPVTPEVCQQCWRAFARRRALRFRPRSGDALWMVSGACKHTPYAC